MPHGISSFSPFHHQQPPPLEVLGMQPCCLLSSLLPSLPSSLCHLLDSKNRVESELYRPCFILHEVLLFLHTCVSWLFTQPLHFFFLFPSVILSPHSAVFTQHRFLHVCHFIWYSQVTSTYENCSCSLSTSQAAEVSSREIWRNSPLDFKLVFSSCLPWRT